MNHETLATLPLFEGIDIDTVANDAPMFTETTAFRGDTLTVEQEHGYSFFVLLEGDVRVEIEGETVGRMGPGDHFGEIALLTGGRRKATVKATERCRLAKVMAWDFDELLERHPMMAHRLELAAGARA